MSFWYLLGLVVAGGKITSDALTIRFPFKSWGKGLRVQQRWLRQSISETMDELNDWLNVQSYPDFAPTKGGANYLLVAVNPPTVLVDLFRNLGIPTSGEIRNNPSFDLGKALKAMSDGDENRNKADFCRGVADVLGSVEASHARGSTGRVSVEFRQANWRLPLQFCKLLHDLGIPPEYIHWGHPNMQTPNATTSHAWRKGHKVRIKVRDFRRLGFHLDCKRVPFAKMTRNLTEQAPLLCPKKNLQRNIRPKHDDERSKDLPIQVRRHFENWNMICRALGCPYAAKRIR